MKMIRRVRPYSEDASGMSQMGLYPRRRIGRRMVPRRWEFFSGIGNGIAFSLSWDPHLSITEATGFFASSSWTLSVQFSRHDSAWIGYRGWFE